MNLMLSHDYLWEWGGWLKGDIHTLYNFCIAHILATSNLCIICVIIKLEHGENWMPK